MRQILPALVIALTVILCLDCGPETPVQPTIPKEPDLSSTPMANEEAEIAAMVLSHKLVAPLPLYGRIADDLRRIRGRYQDSFPTVNLPLMKPWVPSQILLGVDTTVFFDTASPGYKRFDSLCIAYRLDSSRWSIYGEGSLIFEGRLNSARLVDMFAGLPGMCYVSVNGYFNWEHAEAYIFPDGPTFKYFFQDGWGDCPAGCIVKRTSYFSTDRYSVAYRGTYISDAGSPPRWMDTLELAIDTMNDYRSWRSEECQW